MVGDGKAVGLLLDGADEGEDRRDGGDADLLPLRRGQRPGPVAVVLDHAIDWEGKPQLVEYAAGYGGVDAAAVDEQQVWCGVEAAVLIFVMGKAPVEHLVHCGIVVLVLHALELEALVFAFFRLAVLEDHHGGHDVGPGDVGDVVGLHPVQAGQAQHLAQQAEGAAQALLPGRDALRLLPGIPLGNLHEADVVAPLGCADVDALAQLLLDQRLEQRRILHGRGQQDLLWHHLPLQVILLDQGGDGLLLVRGGNDLVVLVQQIAVHIVEHREAGTDLALVVADDVGIRHGPGGDELLLPQGLHGPESIPQLRRALKFQPRTHRQRPRQISLPEPFFAQKTKLPAQLGCAGNRMNANRELIPLRPSWRPQ